MVGSILIRKQNKHSGNDYQGNHQSNDERNQRIERGLPTGIEIVDDRGHGAALAGRRRFS